MGCLAVKAARNEIAGFFQRHVYSPDEYARRRDSRRMKRAGTYTAENRSLFCCEFASATGLNDLGFQRKRNSQFLQKFWTAFDFLNMLTNGFFDHDRSRRVVSPTTTVSGRRGRARNHFEPRTRCFAMSDGLAPIDAIVFRDVALSGKRALPCSTIPE